MNPVDALFNASELGDFDKIRDLVLSSTKYEECELLYRTTVDLQSCMDIAINAKHAEIVRFFCLLGFDKDETLISAAAAGDRVIVQTVLETYCYSILEILDISSRSYLGNQHLMISNVTERPVDVDFRKPLIEAFVAGHMHIVDTLIEAGADTSTVSLQDILPRWSETCHPGHPAVLAALLTPADIGDPDMLETAGENGCVSLVQRMLAEGSNSQETIDSALSRAVRAGHVSVVRAILAVAPIEPSTISYVLKFVKVDPYDEILKALMESLPSNYSKNFYEFVKAGCLHHVHRILPFVYLRRGVVKSALHFASDPAVIRLLIEAGDHNDQKHDLSDLLSTAGFVISRSCKNHQPESVRMLLDANASVDSFAVDNLCQAICNAPKEGKEADQMSVIQMLLAEGTFDDNKTCSMLLSAGIANVTTPVAVAQVLLERWPALLLHKDGYDKTLLDLAYSYGNVALVTLLIDAGASLPRDYHVIFSHVQRRRNPQWRQVVRNRQKVLRVLLAAGLKIVDCDEEGMTAAMLLVGDCHFSDDPGLDSMVAAFLRDICDSILARPAPTDTVLSAHNGPRRREDSGDKKTLRRGTEINDK